MKRALHILGMFALCMVIIATPNRAYALSFSEEQLLGGMMNDYQGNIWDEDVPWYQSTYYSLQNSLTNNAQLALLWEGAASKAAMFLSMNDYLRATFAATYGCYGILDSYIGNIYTKVYTMQGDIEDIRVDVSTLPGLVTAISNKTSEILTKTETISGDLLTLTQNVSTIGNTLAGNQGQQLSKLTDIKTLLTSIDNTLTEGQNITVNAPDVTVNTTDYTGQLADVRNKLTVINGTLTENQNLLSDISDTLAQGQNITVNATDYSTVLDEIKTLLQDGFNVVVNVPETVVNVPDEVKISNWPPYDMPVSYDYSEVLGNIETMLNDGLTVNVGNWPESFVDLQTTNNLLTSINNHLQNLENKLNGLIWTYTSVGGAARNYINVNILRNGDDYADLWTQQVRQSLQNISDKANTINSYLKTLASVVSTFTAANGLTANYISTQPLSTSTDYRVEFTQQILQYLSDIASFDIPSVTNIENLLSDIKNLLKVQNMDNAIGAFDWLLFQQNANQLESDMTHTAPFGVIHLVGSLLALLSAAPVADPSLTMPFNFAGTTQNVVLSVTWLSDLKNIISFVVVLGWILVLARISHDYMRGEVVG